MGKKPMNKLDLRRYYTYGFPLLKILFILAILSLVTIAAYEFFQHSRNATISDDTASFSVGIA